MISISFIMFAVAVSYELSVDGSPLRSAEDDSLRNDSQVEMIINNVSIGYTGEVSEQEHELRQTNDKQRTDRTTVGFLTNGAANLSVSGIKLTVYSDINKVDTGRNASHNLSIMIMNTTQYESTGLTGVELDHKVQEQYLPTEADVQLTKEDKTNEDMIFNKNTLLPNMRYGVNNVSQKVYTWRLDKNRIPIQHHLHLVPMEDEPLGAGMMKEHNYLVGILVPASLAILGAILIIGTICCLRYIARKRARLPRFDSIESLGPHTACISSISADSTDKVFLLRGDDENKFNGDDRN